MVDGSGTTQAEAEATTLKNDGFLMILDVLPPAVLRAARAAFAHAAAPFRASWRHGYDGTMLPSALPRTSVISPGNSSTMNSSRLSVITKVCLGCGLV